MKLHTDTLQRTDLYAALGRTIPDAFLTAVERGSRSRARSFDFRLETDHRGTGRRRNSGTHGAEATYAVSWDEHGRFFAELFERDGEAIIGPYKGRADFHEKTAGQYAGAVNR